MFQICYRILGSEEFLQALDDSDDIEGFFALNVNGNVYGLYHDQPLREYEMAWERITFWLRNLAEACVMLYALDYVAVSDVDSYNTWIEFKKDDDSLFISVIKSTKPTGSGAFSLQAPPDAVYGEWCLQPVSYDEFHEELITKVKLYLEEVACMAPQLSGCKYFLRLSALLNEIVERGVLF